MTRNARRGAIIGSAIWSAFSSNENRAPSYMPMSASPFFNSRSEDRIRGQIIARYFYFSSATRTLSRYIGAAWGEVTGSFSRRIVVISGSAENDLAPPSPELGDIRPAQIVARKPA
jgi:hypothetical protein